MTIRAAKERLSDAKYALRCAEKQQVIERRREVYKAMRMLLIEEMQTQKPVDKYKITLETQCG